MSLVIRPLESAAEAQVCAQLMATSEPWITLGRTYEAGLAMLQDPTRERYVASVAGDLAGFLILMTQGPLVGYIQTVCIAPAHRNKGVGSRLVAFAEQRLFRDFGNVFMFVSSFNDGARRLYARLGYETVADLDGYLVPGHAEILLRKRRTDPR